jgi:type II secretory pathway component GspD/PulD (secretin)
MSRALLLSQLAIVTLTMSACGPPPPREPDPWDEGWEEAGRASAVPEGNVRVDVSAFEIDERDAEGWSFFWAASVPIGGGHLSINGLTSATGGPRFFARLDAWQRRSTVKRMSAPFIVVADGYPASIEVGDVRREPVTVVYRRGGVVVETFEWTKAACSLEVTPRTLGDGRIEVRVRPMVAHREGRGSTRFAELETVAVVAEGEAMIIGGASSSEQTLGSTFFSRYEANRRYRMVFILKARTR